MRRTRSAGFSAIELLVVITIAALLLTWGYPRLATLAQIYRLDGAAWALSTDMQKTRLRAIQEGKPFQVVFYDDKTYQVQSDPTGSNDWEDEGGRREIEDARLLDVTFTPESANPQFTTRGVLKAGSATRVTLEAPGINARRHVHLELGGRIYVNGN